MRSIVGQTFAARFEDTHVVFVHTNRPPTAAEWSRVVAEYRKTPDPRSLRVLVHTEGGAPTAAQRAELVSALGRAQPRIAVLTRSVIARVAAKAVALFAPELRLFDASQLDAALDYLELSGSERTNARNNLEALRNEVLGRGPSPPPKESSR